MQLHPVYFLPVLQFFRCKEGVVDTCPKTGLLVAASVAMGACRHKVMGACQTAGKNRLNKGKAPVTLNHIGEHLQAGTADASRPSCCLIA